MMNNACVLSLRVVVLAFGQDTVKEMLSSSRGVIASLFPRPHGGKLYFFKRLMILSQTCPNSNDECTSNLNTISKAARSELWRNLGR